MGGHGRHHGPPEDALFNRLLRAIPLAELVKMAGHTRTKLDAIVFQRTRDGVPEMLAC